MDGQPIDTQYKCAIERRKHVFQDSSDTTMTGRNSGVAKITIGVFERFLAQVPLC